MVTEFPRSEIFPPNGMHSSSPNSKRSIKAHVDVCSREYIFLKDVENLKYILSLSLSTNFAVIDFTTN